MACIAKRRNRWIIDFYDNKGKRRWKTLPKGTTKTKTKQVLRELEEQIARGSWLPDKKVPIIDRVFMDWLEYKKPNIRLSTWRKYEGYYRNHFDEIKQLKVNRITVATVEKYITKRQIAGMNLSTLRKLIVTFNQVMNYAVRHRYIDHNPVRDAERPKDQGGVEQPPIQILTPPEINALIEAERDQEYRTLIKLSIFSGARQGELLGSKWTDIDWFNSQIHIQRTFNEGAWYRPKTKGSNRKIDLGPEMMKVLKNWLKVCPKTDLNLIFPNKKGGPIDHGNLLRRHFYPAVAIANIKRVRWHDMRHTFASLLIDQGENIKYIQTQLGHASPTITLNVYAHLMKPVNQKSACKLEQTVLKATGSKMVAETKTGVTTLVVNP